MSGRYTEAQRKGIMANRRARATGQWYGYSLADQGYKDAPEMGKSAYAFDRSKAAFGTFTDPTRDQRVVNGVVQWRNNASTPDRLAEGGNRWQDAPDFVQRGYQNSRGVENFGGNWDAYIADKANRFRQRNGQVKVDPNTGYSLYASGQAFDQGGHRISDDAYLNPGAAASLFGRPAPTAPGNIPLGSEGAGGIGGYGAPAIPGQAAPEAFDPNDPYGLKKRRAASQQAQSGNTSLANIGY